MIKGFLDQLSSKHTRRAYRADLVDFFGTDDLQEAQVAAVTASAVRSHLRSLRADDKSISTLRRRLSALRQFYDWLMDRRAVDRNPARECRIDLSQLSDAGKAPSGESFGGLSATEVETLVQATEEAGASSTRDRGLILTILYGALRRAEAAAMNVEHVRPLGRHWIIDLPTGDGPASAYVKIPDTVVEAIDAVQSRYDIDQGPLWRSLSNRNRGARMTPDAIYKVIRRTGRAAGLGDLTVETLRQTGLYLALKGGATMQQVQVHARLQSAGSVERYTDPDEQSSRLDESAVNFVDLDL